MFESFQITFCRYGYRFCQGAVYGCIQVVLRFYTDRINDAPRCVWRLCADLTWYIMSTSKTFHLSVPVELLLKSPRVGNPVGRVLLLLLQHSLGQRNLLANPSVSHVVVGILWVLFAYPFCVSWRWSSCFSKFKFVVCAHTLMLLQDSRWRLLMLQKNSRWRWSSLFACTDASVNSQDGGHARALDGASIYNSRCGNSIIYYLVLFRNFSSTLFDGFDWTDANFHQMLRYL